MYVHAEPGLVRANCYSISWPSSDPHLNMYVRELFTLEIPLHLKSLEMDACGQCALIIGGLLASGLSNISHFNYFFPDIVVQTI